MTDDTARTKTGPKVYVGHEFEALECRFRDQSELLHRLTTIDLRLFSGFITIQLLLGSWAAANQAAFEGTTGRIGIMIVNIVMAVLTIALLRRNTQRRKEATATISNCNEALGYADTGVYLPDKPLNAPTTPRRWFWWYVAGVIAALCGVGLIILAPLMEPQSLKGAAMQDSSSLGFVVTVIAFVLSVLFSAIVGYVFGSAKSFREQKQLAYGELLPPIIKLAYRSPGVDETKFNEALVKLWLYGSKRVTQKMENALRIIHAKGDQNPTQALQEVIAEMRNDIQPWVWSRIDPVDVNHLYTRLSRS